MKSSSTIPRAPCCSRCFLCSHRGIRFWRAKVCRADVDFSSDAPLRFVLCIPVKSWRGASATSALQRKPGQSRALQVLPGIIDFNRRFDACGKEIQEAQVDPREMQERLDQTQSRTDARLRQGRVLADTKTVSAWRDVVDVRARHLRNALNAFGLFARTGPANRSVSVRLASISPRWQSSVLVT